MSVDAQTHTDPEIEEVSTWISHTCYEPHLEDCDSDNGSDSGDEESDTLGAVVLDLGTLWNVGEVCGRVSSQEFTPTDMMLLWPL